MSDTKSGDDKTLSVTPKKTLTLKRPGTEQGTVRQSFSHGRTKAVVVETKKRKFSRPDEKPEAAPAAASPKPKAEAPAAPAAPAAPKGGERVSGVVLSDLSSGEIEARRRALEEAKLREVEERKRAAEDAKRRAEEDERRAREREESERRQAEEAARLQAETEAKVLAEEKARKRNLDADTSKAAMQPDVGGAGDAEGARGPRRSGGGGGGAVKPEAAAPRPAKPKAEEDRRRGKLTLNRATSDDGEGRGRSLSSMRRRMEKFKRSQIQEPREKIIREVVLPETITVQELAQRMAERSVEVVKFMMKQGQMIKPGDVIDADTAELIAVEFGHTVKRVSESDVETGIFGVEDRPEDLKQRPPVVTIMGHVDHGKTSLLDAIRKTNVVSGEAGGITQHIGAYQVTSPSHGKITFIDTPGHAAFTAMRARGAKVTDIVVLVVAADDGVMPQTVEAVHHAKAAKVPIIVAINKIDKPDAKPDRVRTELLQHEIQVESLGGDVLDVEVSAIKKLNLDKLLETVGLQAEILDLKANPDRPAEGTVIEAKLDRGRGPVATVLVQRGTLHVGDIVIAGTEWGRVRALVNDNGQAVQGAGPSIPVEVLGFNGTPDAGDRLAVVQTEARAREVTDYRARQRRDKMAARATGMRGSLEQMMAQVKTAGRKEFPLIIKGDVQGSIEAIQGALEKLSTEEVAARIIHSGAGGITESDVTLAESSGAAIIGFNVRAHKEARAAAEQAGTEIRYYNIIYDLVDDVKKAMSGLLAPTMRETMLGNAQVLEIFNVSKVGKIAGCRVTDGVVERGANVRLIRDNVVVHEGKLSQLKRFKDDAREVSAGQECGMAFENYQDMRVGDVIECYRVEQVQRSL
ncbi:MAG: translation initiation factor IF-2 [Notoacmeibacter sp.]|nr:translation initiation factor IF-2 [Notoacmeibacter sp.]